MHDKHQIPAEQPPLRMRLLAGLALAVVIVVATSITSRADAAWYGGVGFCNASSSAGGNVKLTPGQRCVETHPIRAELMAVTEEIAETHPYPYNNSYTSVANLCVVGKQTWSGGGGNVYPVTCGITHPFPNENIVWGPWTNPNLANSSYPTIINQTPPAWNVYYAWMRGSWWGLWP